MPVTTPHTALLTLRQLPQQYRRPADHMGRRLLSSFPNTVALIVIGSVAADAWQPDSDLDLVWIYRGRRPRRWWTELDLWGKGPVELVPFNMTQLRRHFRQHNPMAHALRSGIALYDPEGLLHGWQQLNLGLPTQEWIDEIYEFMWSRFEWGLDSYRRACRFHRRANHHTADCTCQVSEILTRATLNLVRLLLTLRGHVPLCKAHTRELFPGLTRGRRLRQAMEITLEAHHEHRDLTLRQAREVAYLGTWAKGKLAHELGLPRAEERVQQMHKLLPP